MSVRDKDVPEFEGIEHDDLLQFAISCDGRIKPCVVRPDLFEAMDADEVASLPQLYQNSYQYVTRWLDVFQGHQHTCSCLVCNDDIQCAHDNDHDEIGAFVVLQSEHMDIDIGGFVMALCPKCAQMTDSAIYHAVADYLSGDDDVASADYEPKEPKPEHLDFLSKVIDKD